jgi:hypothetical protein
MKLDVSIDHLVIDAATRGQIDPTRLKAAVERELGAMLAGRQPTAADGGRSYAARSRPGDTSPQARLARDLAAKVYGAMR